MSIRPGQPWLDTKGAPVYFRRGAKHYLFTSGTSGYFPNPTEVAVADTYHGPWTVLGNPHPGDPTGTSYRSQISSVFEHPHHDDLYIALADRWLPDVPAETSATVLDRMATMLASGAGLPDDAPSGLAEPNTSIADYVWLPVRFDSDMPYLDWHDEWRIEDVAATS